MVQRLYDDSLALGNKEKSNENGYDEGLWLRQRVPVQGIDSHFRMSLQSLHLQALRLLTPDHIGVCAVTDLW
jgi:hypothetical protein